MSTSFKNLTADEKEAIMASRAEPGRVVECGMAKWQIGFADGKTCTMLSPDCRTVEAAYAAAVEKFGAKVLWVK